MKKAIYVSIIVIIIVAIIFTALMLILKYEEKGETNMPFNISKISIISTTDAEQIEDKKNLWNKAIQQNNDIYIYIEKNESYQKIETIKNIKINNIKVIETPQKGEIQMYRPSTSEKELFQNKEEYAVTELSFLGEQQTNIQNLQISNQGGIIAFRCANEKLGNYISNEKQINYDDLLKKINITQDQIKAKISFELSIILQDEKEFKTTVELDIPIEGVVENGRSSIEKTDLNLVFKRIEK